MKAFAQLNFYKKTGFLIKIIILFLTVFLLIGSKNISYSYKIFSTSRKKINPFASLITTKNEIRTLKINSIKNQKKFNRVPRSLEKFDFSEIKLVGIVMAKSGNIAIIEEFGGKGYIVKVGTALGKNNGKIIKIYNDRIIIKEKIKNLNGDLVADYKEMKLDKTTNDD